jgi:hypothetical protein
LKEIGSGSSSGMEAHTEIAFAQWSTIMEASSVSKIEIKIKIRIRRAIYVMAN